jgi:hypothetical protein
LGLSERVCAVTESTKNTDAGGHVHPCQADLEKDEEDLAEDKKVRVLAGGGRVQMWE